MRIYYCQKVGVFYSAQHTRNEAFKLALSHSNSLALSLPISILPFNRGFQHTDKQQTF
jgi:hypothetical protein